MNDGVPCSRRRRNRPSAASLRLGRSVLYPERRDSLSSTGKFTTAPWELSRTFPEESCMAFAKSLRVLG